MSQGIIYHGGHFGIRGASRVRNPISRFLALRFNTRARVNYEFARVLIERGGAGRRGRDGGRGILQVSLFSPLSFPELFIFVEGQLRAASIPTFRRLHS